MRSFSKLPRPSGATSWLLSLASLACGAVAAVLLVPHSTLPDSEQAPPLELSYLGRPLTFDDDSLEEALDRSRRFTERTFTLELPDGDRRTVALSALGASIDTTRLTRLVRDARDPHSVL
ncbi:MAG TPA: hypothetical protein VLC09_19725, partial [Polyangiaceae bacterium]|nr:hypothetical protein [Polyangiaceae bacterium]